MHLGHIIKQKGYEHIVFILRRHWLILLRSLLLYVILFALPVGFYFALSFLFPALLGGPVFYSLLILAAGSYYLSVWLFFFTAILDYYLDTWVVSNDRIINIEQLGLFDRTVSELDLYKVQDVTSEVKGIFPTVFNYGNVLIQTAGTEQKFIFEQIPNPHEVRKKIVDLIEEDRKHHNK
jgi:uncharacterized membrane protein YdbT with pleckstrin-like domain